MWRWGIGCAALLLAAAGIAKTPSPDLIVHEWGTFLAMDGSDGVSLDSMYHEEHALPTFVHARSRDQLHLRSAIIKGETPVIYFYTDRPQRVRVHVGFPHGIWTQWYPQASFVGPSLTAAGSPPQLRNGHIEWDAEVVPARTTPVSLPKTASDALWNYAREVDSAFVRTKDGTTGGKSEYERFLFYRGLGDARLPLRMTAARGGTLALDASLSHALRHLFILRVENGKGVFRYLPSLPPGAAITDAIPSMTKAQPLNVFTKRIADALAERLTESGLYPKEARAMVNTWRTSYFQNDGIRALFIMPQAWTDAFIPMTLDPKPKELARVMVGRLEMLTPQREKVIEAAVRDLASPDAGVREKAFGSLRNQGRYVEPILRRTLQTTQNPTVKRLCKRLLLTDFVTEIRSAVYAASDGRKVTDQPVHLRAQLASLLHEVGLDDDAKKEASLALAELKTLPEPRMNDHMARFTLRSTARAMEGMGDDRRTAEAYGKLVKFGSGVKTCGGCHLPEGPRDMAWFRDWWAGRKYAEYVEKTGQRDGAIRSEETTLAARPGDTEAMMKLAYLYASQGQKAKSDRIWAVVTSSPSERVAARQKIP